MLLLSEIKGFQLMKEKDLTIDLTKHKVYTKNAKKCVQKLLHCYRLRRMVHEKDVEVLK